MSADIGIVDPTDVIFQFPCVRLRQPIGELFVAALPYKILCTIADFDVRKVIEDDRDLDRYLGIQRPLNMRRVAEIRDYVNFADAAFPTAIILAIDDRCAEFDADTSTMTLRNVRDEERPVLARKIARVIDGQHRIAGLYKCVQDHFECPVTIIVGADIADQAQMFARVNLTQTPVSRSLVYDLFELAKTRSPQKTCHETTVRLDRATGGPLFQRIKRLGTATPGRDAELLTQATVVRGLMQHISDAPDRDRDIYLRGKEPSRPTRKENEAMIFRAWFLDKREVEIFEAVSTLLTAVRERWPRAWAAEGVGYVLPRTSGFLALMKYLRDATLYWSGPDSIVSVENHLKLLARVPLDDDDFTTEHFRPGSSGEAAMYRIFVGAIPR